jgi:hypothetical protein
MNGTQLMHNGLYEALVKLGLTTLKREDLPEPVPVDWLADFCANRGLRYYRNGEALKFLRDTPVVAIYHYDSQIDSATYQLIQDVDLGRSVSGLIVKVPV